MLLTEASRLQIKVLGLVAKRRELITEIAALTDEIQETEEKLIAEINHQLESDFRAEQADWNNSQPS